MLQDRTGKAEGPVGASRVDTMRRLQAGAPWLVDGAVVRVLDDWCWTFLNWTRISSRSSSLLRRPGAESSERKLEIVAVACVGTATHARACTWLCLPAFLDTKFSTAVRNPAERKSGPDGTVRSGVLNLVPRGT